MHKIPDTKYLYNYNKTLTCIYLYEADLFTLYNFELTSASSLRSQLQTSVLNDSSQDEELVPLRLK